MLKEKQELQERAICRKMGLTFMKDWEILILELGKDCWCSLRISGMILITRKIRISKD